MLELYIVLKRILIVFFESIGVLVGLFFYQVAENSTIDRDEEALKSILKFLV